MNQLINSLFILASASLVTCQDTVSPTTLQPVILNETIKILNYTKCRDPLMPFLRGGQKGTFYGCCGIVPQTVDDSKMYCCLLAGSRCDVLYEKSPNPCNAVPCCPTEKRFNQAYGIVRINGNDPNYPNLRFEFPTSFYLFPSKQRSYRIALSQKIRDPDEASCTDNSKSGLKLGREGTYLGLRFFGCCSKEVKTPQDSSKYCCLLLDSPCDGTVPCCRGAPCTLGKCSIFAGRNADFDKSTKANCKIYDKSKVNAPQPKSVSADGTCISESTPFKFKLGSSKNKQDKTACCRYNQTQSTKGKEITKNCCLLSSSACDTSIPCCTGEPCCTGKCGIGASQIFSQIVSPIC